MSLEKIHLEILQLLMDNVPKDFSDSGDISRKILFKSVNFKPKQIEKACDELESRGLKVVRQQGVPIVYKDVRLATDLRLDLVVEGKVIVECKATKNDNPIFEAQALTYLRLMDLRLALVINFGKRLVKDGVHRVVNRL